MNKILIILQREYLTRVRKRTFLLVTFISPLLFAGIFIIPTWLALSTEAEKFVLLLDETNTVFPRLELKKDSKLKFSPSPAPKLEDAKKLLSNKEYYALVYIPKLDWNNPKGIEVFSEKGISVEAENAIQRYLTRAIERYKMEKAGLKEEELNKIKAHITINSYTASGKESSSAGLFIFGFLGGFIIYFSIFMYGAQVMRGVVEEKTSRVVEVIISTVKPYQLMMGKILGIGLVGLTQYALWAVLTFGIMNFAIPMLVGKELNEKIMKESTKNSTPQNQAIAEKINKAPNGNILAIFNQVNMWGFAGVFIFYFLFGYLMYASLFAAFASAVDNEAEMQQFMLPLTIPLILAIASGQVILRDADGALAFWMSMFPLTSPIVMVLRYPFGVPMWQLLLSMSFLVLGFVALVWLAGRIYRVGILMYGKKVNYRELSKWIFYK